MEKSQISIGSINGSVVGGIGSDINVASSLALISASSAPVDLKQALQELVDRTNKIAPGLAPATAGELVRHINEVVDEATQETPKRRQLALLAAKIADLAKVAAIALPIADLADKIITLV